MCGNLKYSDRSFRANDKYSQSSRAKVKKPQIKYIDCIYDWILVRPCRDVRGEPGTPVFRGGGGGGQFLSPSVPAAGRSQTNGAAVSAAEREANGAGSARTETDPASTPRRPPSAPGLLAAGEPIVALCPRKVHASKTKSAAAFGPGSSACSSISRDVPRVPGGRDDLNSAGRLCGPTRLPLGGFTYSWTLSSKFFSTFPHGTCPLSDSRLYLALDGVYHPLWAAFSNNPTLGTLGADESRAAKGLTPAVGEAPIRRTWARARTRRRLASPTPQFPAARRCGFGAGLFPRRLQVERRACCLHLRRPRPTPTHRPHPFSPPPHDRHRRRPRDGRTEIGSLGRRLVALDGDWQPWTEIGSLRRRLAALDGDW